MGATYGSPYVVLKMTLQACRQPAFGQCTSSIQLHKLCLAMLKLLSSATWLLWHMPKGHVAEDNCFSIVRHDCLIVLRCRLVAVNTDITHSTQADLSVATTDMLRLCTAGTALLCRHCRQLFSGQRKYDACLSASWACCAARCCSS